MSNEGCIKYSIITCMYNAEQYLQEYFKELNKQTYRNFEVIIVDDCSTDNTPHLAEEISRNYPLDVHIISTSENLGPGNARNLGIEKCTGDRVVILDVDDFLTDDALQLLSQFIEYDCVFFDYYRFAQSGDELCGNEIYGTADGMVSKPKALRDSLGAPWGKVYKAEIIKQYGITFPNLMSSEDLVFCKRYINRCNSFYYIKEPLYKYRVSSKSLMHRNLANQLKDSLEALRMVKMELSEYPGVFRVIYNREYLYDRTLLLIMLGKSRERLYSFWRKSKSITIKDIFEDRDGYTRSQKAVLALVSCRAYFALKVITRFKK